MSTGKVFLVGAGPGARDLITLRGARLLEKADVVVYDALASAELLDLANPDAELHNVGKRGHEAPTLPQEETTELLLELDFAQAFLLGVAPFIPGDVLKILTASAIVGRWPNPTSIR